MNEQTKRAAEAFARTIMGDDKLMEGFCALCEGLEWAAFQRWRQSDAEGWRMIAGELAAVRNLLTTVKTVGIGHGKLSERDQ